MNTTMNGNPAFEFNCELTIEDLMAFQRHYAENDRKVKSALRRIWPLMLVIAVLAVGAKVIGTGEISPADIGLLFIFALLALLFTRGFGKFNAGVARRLYDQPGNRWLTGTKRVTLADEGIGIGDEVKTVRLKWEGIVKAADAADHFFLYDSAVSAIIIPKRCLDGDGIDRVRAILNARRIL